MPSTSQKQKAATEDLLSDFQTPASLGYAMPAEWEHHEATWIAWPHNHEDWPEKFEPIPWIYAEIVRLLAQGERVHIFVQPSKGNRFAKDVLKILERNGGEFVACDVSYTGDGSGVDAGFGADFCSAGRGQEARDGTQ